MSYQESLDHLHNYCSLFAVERFSYPVPTPVSLVKYIEDPDFEHEDFTLSAATTLRARVCMYVCMYIRMYVRLYIYGTSHYNGHVGTSEISP